MIVIVGESGCGKSSVAKELEKYGYHRIITYTTRPKRENEIDGVDYHFISNKFFYRMNARHEFAETATYRGWNYGSAAKDYDDKGVIVLTPKGLRSVVNSGLNVSSFYINVPRRDRLIKLLERGDDIEECYRRSLSDVGQFDGIEDEVDHTIINQDYEKSPEKMAKIINMIYKEDLRVKTQRSKQILDSE